MKLDQIDQNALQVSGELWRCGETLDLCLGPAVDTPVGHRCSRCHSCSPYFRGVVARRVGGLPLVIPIFWNGSRKAFPAGRYAISVLAVVLDGRAGSAIL